VTNDILFRSATETAELLRTRAISSRELMDHLLDRIDAVNPGLNAVVEVRREQALRTSNADRAISDGHADAPGRADDPRIASRSQTPQHLG
jgi:amidase